MINLLILFFSLFALSSCSDKSYTYNQENLIIGSEGLAKRSTTAGNLITTAIQRVHNLDVVLYPSDFLSTSHANLFRSQMNTQTIDSLSQIYASGDKDRFAIGNMTGRAIKTLIRQRTLEKYSLDLEVAGASYDIMISGGTIISEQYNLDGNRPLIDEQNYLVAISQYFLRPGGVFPPYQYRNNIDGLFRETNKKISASESLTAYLKSNEEAPFLAKIRARVQKTKGANLGFKNIHTIQGISFLSPFRGDQVQTQGIVTAIARIENYPGGYEAYIQSQYPDSDDRTSEGLKLYFDENPSLSIGQLVSVAGTVYEEQDNGTNTLTATSLRDITFLKVLASDLSLPDPIVLGVDGKIIPSKQHSSYRGDLNFKPSLNLKDGLDFWESLEGMRVQISNPRVVGFRGGKEGFDDDKRHITLFLSPENGRKNFTSAGGVMATPDLELFNPDIMTLSSGDLTVGVSEKTVYNIGDIIEGSIEGIMTFTKNLFGESEFLFQLPQASSAIASFESSRSARTIKPLEERPIFLAEKSERKLSIAAYNIKNLSAINGDEKRLEETARMINVNLKCPDILGLVEIQDFNGEDFSGNSQAKQTIDKLIEFIPKEGSCSDVDYRAVNIDPLSHREGGVPGANIRVALIYNQNRLDFTQNRAPTPLTETLLEANGDLNFNPGRVFPNDEAFANSRKSIVAQFKFKGEDVFVIVNHFNSKLGDTSHFSAVQPIHRDSEIRRAKMAQAVNRFTSLIERRNPKSHIAVIGDFNAYLNEVPMSFLENDVLYNLMRTIPENRRYTTNHNGNSQSLDYIFVNKNFKNRLDQFDVIQVNSDFMGRLSDHDPIISTFNF